MVFIASLSVFSFALRCLLFLVSQQITSRLGQIADNVQPLLKGENSTVFIFGIVLGVFLTSFVFVMLTPSPSPTRRSKPSSRTAAATEDDDGDDVDGHPKSS